MCNDVDVICFVETWFNKDELNLFNINGFKPVASYVREETKHGGVSIYTKTDIDSKHITLRSIDVHAEFACIEIANSNLILICTYRSPLGNINMFLEILETNLKLIPQNKNVIVLGDFNVNFNEDNSNTVNCINVLTSYNLSCGVEGNTRVTEYGATKIDNMFSNIDSNCISSTIIEPHLSDHRGILTKVTNLNVQRTPEKTIISRKFNEQNNLHFKNLLCMQSWINVYSCNHKDVNKQWAEFTTIFTRLFNECFPVTKIKLQSQKKSMFFADPELKELKKQLDILDVICKHNKNYKVLYNLIRNKYHKKLTELKRNYYSNYISDTPNKSKGIWSVVNSIKGNKQKQNGIEMVGDPIRVVNDFNYHFVNVASNLTSTLPNGRLENRIQHSCRSMFIEPVTMAEIFSIVQKLKQSKSSGIDDVPNFVIKGCAMEICEPLSYIMNNSLNEGIFPDQLKKAQIKPLYKKGDHNVLDNYRPINLLPSFSKIFETIMVTRLTDYFVKYNLFNECQHGFLKGKTTETAVFKFVQTIMRSLENKKYAVGCFLDLSKAFDTMDKTILFEKLEKYGVRGKALDWIQSYFCGRSQVVKINVNSKQYVSESLDVKLGVPQGSVLGPLLFVIYMNDLANVLINMQGVFLVNYADDTSLFVEANSANELVLKVKNALNSIEQWFHGNRLKLNLEKTSIIEFKTQYKENYTLIDEFQKLDINVKESCNFLGIQIDGGLVWKDHILKLQKKCNMCHYSIRILKPYLKFNDLKVVYFAHFQSVVRYGIVFWGQAVDIQKIFIVQKRIIRTMLGLRASESCRGHFKQCDLLTVFGIYIFELVVFIYKYRHYFAEFEKNHVYNTRNDNKLNIPAHRLTLFEKSCLYAAIKCYNKLPIEIQNLSNVKHFKFKVKQYLVQVEPYSLDEYLK